MEIKKAMRLFLMSTAACLSLSQTAHAIECYIGNRSPSIAQGAAKQIGANCDRYGNTKPISVTSNAPAGISVSANPNPMTGKTTSLTFAVARSVAANKIYKFNVTFQGGTETSTQPMELKVLAGSGGSSGNSGSGGSSGSSGSGGTGGSSGSSGMSGSAGGSSGSAGAPIPSSYSISAPAALSVQQNTNLTSIPVTINRTNFTSAVALSVSGLPSGVTSTVSPSSTTGSNCTMALNVGPTVAPNTTYPLTVRASSGGTVQTASVSLTVTPQPANFTMTSPTSSSIQQGQSATFTVNLSRTNMPDAIDVTLSGLPAGVSGSCASSTGTTSLCSLTADDTATPGTSSLGIQANGGGITRSASLALSVTAPPPPPPSGGLRAFPGAEGFGAFVTGGRGGKICKVTNTNSSGAGSFQDCMNKTEPTYILFTTSGVVRDSVPECHYGHKTIAGQTSPAGMIFRGFEFDNTYESNPNCRNIIMRHLRMRPGMDELGYNGWVTGDGTRLDGVRDLILDHISIGRSSDEAVQISRTMNLTIQNSHFAETLGDHFWGGVLLNYSLTGTPLNNITLHHNTWNRIRGRFPELSCEENNDGAGRNGSSNCSGHVLNVEIANNVYSDPIDPIYYNRCTGTNQGNDCAASASNFLLNMNWVGNYMRTRSDFTNPMIVDDIMANSRNQIYYRDNYLDTGNPSLYELTVGGLSRALDFPEITETPSNELLDHMIDTVGAFPRDEMDQRLVSYLSQDVDQTPIYYNKSNTHGATLASAKIPDTYRVLQPACSASPLDATHDTDNDGMPDSWERDHGLNVGVDDHNVTGPSGYPYIEEFLNELSDRVILEGTNAICQYL